MNQLYALLKSGELRFIDLAEEVVEPTDKLFLKAMGDFINDETVQIPFDGNYSVRENENELLYLDFELPAVFGDIPDNQEGITTLDVENDDIKSLIWFHNGSFLFQIFSSSNLLENKYVIKFFQEEHTFNRMKDKAFIINNKIQAIHKDDKLLFKSFPNASKIFDLSEHMVEATTEEVHAFGNNDIVNVDVNWLTVNANNKTRRLIKMITESRTLETFMGMSAMKRTRIAKSVNVDISIYDGRLVLPSSLGKLNKILEFLNEDVYRGLITERIYRTNSKRGE